MGLFVWVSIESDVFLNSSNAGQQSNQHYRMICPNVKTLLAK